jgi:peptidoglycan/xylan/chitin deacetylase (PgdA/CDA1 family)
MGIRLGELIEGWTGRRSLPARPIVLTFDDGFRNLLDHALPALKKWGFRATVFAVAGYLGKKNDWPSQPTGIPRYPLLCGAELGMLARDGIEIGAHTVTHPYLTRLPAAEAKAELLESKRILEQVLGHHVTSFAYPYGALTSEILDNAREYFRAACGVEMLSAHRAGDYHRLPRIDAFYFRRPCLFTLLGTSAGRLYIRLRGLGRQVRALFMPREL